MTGNPVGLVEFLLARLDDEQRPTFELVPYECEPGCCAPAGWVGHRCLLCGTTEYGGTVEAITEISRGHEQSLHRRSYVLADIAAKRRIIELHKPDQLGFGPDVIGCCTCDAVLPETWGPDLLQPGQQLYPCETALLLAAPFSSHPDWQPEWSTE